MVESLPSLTSGELRLSVRAGSDLSRTAVAAGPITTADYLRGIAKGHLKSCPMGCQGGKTVLRIRPSSTPPIQSNDAGQHGRFVFSLIG